MSDANPPDPTSEERFRTIVEHIPMVVTYLDLVDVDAPLHSTPVYISPQIEELLGFDRSAWLDDQEIWLQVLHPDDADRMRAADVRARETLGTLTAEYRMIARDGRIVWVSENATVVTDVASGVTYWQGVMVDITERKLAQEALEESERRFRSIFAAAAIGVMTLAVDGRIEEANPTLERVGGYAAGELDGVSMTALVGEEDVAVRELVADLTTGTRERGEAEHRFRRRDGSMMWCRTVMTLVRHADDAPAHVIVMLEDIGDRKRMEADLVRRALHDGLTGLPNRQLFLDRLRVAVVRRERPADAIGTAVFFLDLDGFKAVNDSLGHDAGDQLLVAVADRLRAAVRPGDTVARFAGDEFVVLADDVVSLDHALELARRLRSSLDASFTIAGERVDVTVSIGLTVSFDDDAQAEEVLRRADAAMYRAKRHGRNRVEILPGDEDDLPGTAAA